MSPRASSRKKRVLTRAGMLLLFVGIIIQGIPYATKPESKDTLDKNEENDAQLRSSGHYLVWNITIDPLGGGNGTWTWAVSEDWCHGSGTFNDPYVIENVTLSARWNSSGITIRNSGNVFFVIRNCNVSQSSDGATDAGIKLINVSNGTITDVNCSNNQAHGFYLKNSFNITISNNYLMNNSKNGILVNNTCNRVDIISNTIKNSSLNGIYINDGATLNTILQNTLINNTRSGIVINDTCKNNNFTSNIVQFNNRSGIVLQNNCNWTIISNNLVKNNTLHGLKIILSSNNNTISNNEIINNTENGILLDSESTTIKENLIKRNGKIGTNLTTEARYNTIYFNAFFGHASSVEDHGSDNAWNTSLVGNYYSDYNGVDVAPFDGIGDTPHDIDISIQDQLPLMNSPLFNGSRIYIDDNGVSALNWSRTAVVYKWCTGSGTENEPYLLENLEIDAEGIGSCIKITNSSVNFTIQTCNLTNAASAGNEAGIYLIRVNNSIISNVNSSNNQGNGIVLTKNCSNNKITDSVVSYNTGGFNITWRSNENTISNNRIFENVIDALYLDISSIGNNISENFIYNNTENGIKIQDNCNHTTISRNKLWQNGLRGVFIDDNCDNNTIYNNTIYKNGDNGIEIKANSDFNSILDNHIKNNTKSSIKILTDCRNTTIKQNKIKHNYEHGIYLYQSVNTSINSNLIFNNSKSGICLEMRSNTNYIGDNAIYDNADHGIYLYINCDNNTISNNKIYNTYPIKRQDIGIYLNDLCGNNTIIDNEIYNHSQQGCFLQDNSNNNTIKSNSIFENSHEGVIFGGSYNNSIKLNDIFKNDKDGILLRSISSNNSFFENHIHHNSENGVFITDFSKNNTFLKNDINCNGEHGIKFDEQADGNWILENFIFNNTQIGISLKDVSFVKIRENVIQNNTNGIYLESNCYNNQFYKNTIKFNSIVGVNISDASSTGNIFYENRFLVNRLHAKDDSNPKDNFWNTTTIGNYWDNYTGVDDNPQDGIGDKPYNITGNAKTNDSLPIWDDDPPDITIHTPTANQWVNGTAPTYSLTIIDVHLDSYWYSINNGINRSLSSTQGQIEQAVWTALSEGSHVLTFYANDTFGFLSQESITVNKDSIMPVLSINKPRSNSYYRTTPPEFLISVIEANVLSKSYSIVGQLASYSHSIIDPNGTIDEEEWNALGEGQVTLTFYVEDKAGNDVSKAVIFYKDTKKPNVTINEPLNNSVYRTLAPHYNLTIEDKSPYTIWYTFDGGNRTTTTPYSVYKIDQFIWEYVPNGTHVLEFHVKDAAGNTNYDQITIQKRVNFDPGSGDLETISGENSMTAMAIFGILLTIFIIGLIGAIMVVVYFVYKKER